MDLKTYSSHQSQLGRYEQLADVVDGKAFVLQGGDSAEIFAEFNTYNIIDTLKLMLQRSLVLTQQRYNRSSQPSVR